MMQTESMLTFGSTLTQLINSEKFIANVPYYCNITGDYTVGSVLKNTRWIYFALMHTKMPCFSTTVAF